jgi:YD repeat-containing protein
LQTNADTRVVTSGGASAPTVVVATNGTRTTLTRSVYDWNSRVIYAMAANGAVTQYQYDAAGRRTNTLVYTNYLASVASNNAPIAPTGGALATSYQYDANGNQTAMLEPLGGETDYQYDGGNRLVYTFYPLNAGETARHETALTYDGLGQKLAETDEAGVKTAYTYDWRGLVTSVTVDAGNAHALVWAYAYDEFGDLIAQTDPNSGVTQFAYDALGRRTQRMLSDGTKERTTYSDVRRAAA